MAGKRRVRVALSDDECVFFKFQERPTREQIEREVERLKAARAAESQPCPTCGRA